jgi:hypothetical protein
VKEEKGCSQEEARRRKEKEEESLMGTKGQLREANLAKDARWVEAFLPWRSSLLISDFCVAVVKLLGRTT